MTGRIRMVNHRDVFPPGSRQALMFFPAVSVLFIVPNIFSNRTPLDQVLLNCWFGLVVWVFLITLIF